jgi:choline dehydrogenase-like flavoprotein
MLLSSLKGDTLLPHAAVCIIGAGAAGITLASELDGCGFPVLLLDAGGLKLDLAASNAMYCGDRNGRHPDPTEFRRTGFGGTTRIWGGRCVPYDPIDFERRDHVPRSGWPITYDDVAQHYPRAMEYCDAGVFDFAVDDAIERAQPTIPGLKPGGALMHDRIERYSLPTDFGKRYRAQLEHSKNVTVALGLRCLRLLRRDDGSIESVEVVDAAGARRHIGAQTFVLATGGIEVVRLLLASDPDGPGLGNAGGQLGRNYQCHFENVFAKLVTRGTPLAFNFEKTVDGVYARRKLQFTAEAQHEHRLLNTAFRLHFPDYSDASHRSGVLSAIYLAKSFLIPEYQSILQHGSQAPAVSTHQAHLRNMLLDLPAIVRFAFVWLFKIVLARRKLPYTLIASADGSYPLEFNSEQMPRADNRITLTQALDEHGMPGVHVEWKLGEEDIQSGRRAFSVLREAIAKTPGCTVEFDDERLDDAIRHSVAVGGHHIGAARMASSPQDGVVDANCAVFGSPNLFVASSAVFPTSSHANPTLTIVAVTIRLAAHLKQQLLPVQR